MSQIIGVDVGGTFTDLISFDTNTDTVRIAKVLSTPKNPVSYTHLTLPTILLV